MCGLLPLPWAFPRTISYTGQVRQGNYTFLAIIKSPYYDPGSPHAMITSRYSRDMKNVAFIPPCSFMCGLQGNYLSWFSSGVY